MKDGPKATGRPEVEGRKENTEKKMADMNVQNVKIQNECCSILLRPWIKYFRHKFNGIVQISYT